MSRFDWLILGSALVIGTLLAFILVPLFVEWWV